MESVRTNEIIKVYHRKQTIQVGRNSLELQLEHLIRIQILLPKK